LEGLSNFTKDLEAITGNCQILYFNLKKQNGFLDTTIFTSFLPIVLKDSFFD